MEGVQAEDGIHSSRSKSRSGNLGGIDTRESKAALMSTGIASETAKDVVRQNAEEV